MKEYKLLIIFFLLFSANSIAQFGNPIIIDSSFSITLRNIITADIDNDGKKDIITSGTQNSINWYKNLDSTFSDAQSISSSFQYPFHLGYGDVNGDGFTDLLVTKSADNSSGVSVFINNNGGISWTQTDLDTNIVLGAFKSFFIDVENDGDLDVITNGDIEITLYKNNGNGIFTEPISIESLNEYYSMTANDFTGDGFDDLIINTATSGMVLFTNNTDGSFSSPATIDNGLRIFLTSSDIDNDDNIDVVSGNPANVSEVQFYKNNDSGSFSFSHNEPNSDALDITNAKFNLIDLNEDNFKDILYIDINSIFWKENDQTGLFSSPSLINNSYSFRNVFSDDIDNDGDNDIIWFGINNINSVMSLGVIKNVHTSVGLSTISKKNKVELFPNPATNNISIITNAAINYVKIYNSNGQFVKTVKTKVLDVTDLEKGLYFITILTKNNEQITVKFIKE